MRYHLVVNQPCTPEHAGRVITGMFRFILGADPQLKRLEDYWRPLSDGLGLYDSFNRQVLKFAVETDDNENPVAFNVDGDWYIPDPHMSTGTLDDVIEVFNDYYSDKYMFSKSPIGYAYYKAEQ